MKKNKNKKYTDHIGRTILTADGLFDLVTQSQNINGLLVEDCEDTRKYNQFSEHKKLKLYDQKQQELTQEQFDKTATSLWKTPQEYKQIDLNDWFLSRCNNQMEQKRVLEELNMYEERDLFPLLKHLIFLVDHFRKNNVVWGVGRGSSVSSYCLYLIGIHKIDSLKYNLDISEFLR